MWPQLPGPPASDGSQGMDHRAEPPGPRTQFPRMVSSGMSQVQAEIREQSWLGLESPLADSVNPRSVYVSTPKTHKTGALKGCTSFRQSTNNDGQHFTGSGKMLLPVPKQPHTAWLILP